MDSIQANLADPSVLSLLIIEGKGLISLKETEQASPSPTSVQAKPGGYIAEA